MIFGNIDARQARAIIERPISDGSNSLRDRDVRQTGAIRERFITDGSDAIRNRDVRQTGAMRERQISDGSDGVGDGYFLSIHRTPNQSSIFRN